MHNKIVEFLNTNIPGCEAFVNPLVAEKGDLSITLNSSHLYKACKALKESSEFECNVLQVITGTDYADRIEVSYILASFLKNLEFILKVKLTRESPKVDSVVSLWKSANFLEREVFDMLGVDFTGHPDLRRILCPDDWIGFPLRRDYIVQETYLGMEVNPPAKNNTYDQMFGKRLKEELGDPKRVSSSWKESTTGNATEAKDGE